MNILSLVNRYFLSPFAMGVLFLCGGILLWRQRGFPLTSPLRVIRGLFSGNILSSFKAMTLALAGTLGVGNIVGVATAIKLGGAGSVFWMLMSALVAMGIKYAEIYLAVIYRKKDRGGAAYYIKYALNKPRLAGFFSLLCLCSSFTVGNMIQVNAVSDAFESELRISPWITGLLLSLLVFAVIRRGVRGISFVTLYLIPLISVAYILLCAVMIIANRERLGEVLSQIINSAFKYESGAAGVVGFLTSKGLRYGVIRGIGSNEAGCGTAPTAHTTAETDSPEGQGMWGIFEVFCDTVIICTATAIVILMNPQQISANDGMVLAIKAFEGFYGEIAGAILSGAIFVFAFSTLISWAYYGSEAIRYFTDSRELQSLYRWAYCLVAFLGSFVSVRFAWELSDLTVSLMTVINSFCLILLSKKIVVATNRYM